MDIGDSTISLQLPPALSVDTGFLPNSVTLGDLDDSSLVGPHRVAVSITDVTGLTAGDVTFTADSVTIDMQNTSWSNVTDPDSLLVIRLVFGTQQVPTPATLILLAAGLGLAAAWRRR